MTDRTDEIRQRCDAGWTVRITDVKYLLGEIERLNSKWKDALALADLNAILFDKATSRAEQAERKRDAAVERCQKVEEALLDMTVQFSSYDGVMKHSFMSAEETAYDILDIDYGEKASAVYERYFTKWEAGKESRP